MRAVSTADVSTSLPREVEGASACQMLPYTLNPKPPGVPGPEDGSLHYVLLKIVGSIGGASIQARQSCPRLIACLSAISIACFMFSIESRILDNWRVRGT